MTIAEIQSRFLKPAAGQRRMFPSPAEMAVNFASATARFVTAGMPVVTAEQYEARYATCLACPHWQAERCALCGCFKVKLWLATEKCPKDKWPATTT